MEKALAHIQQARDIFKERGAIGRVYSSRFGPTDVIVWEENFDSVEDHDRLWAELGGTPETKAWFQKWFELVELGGSQEVWNLQA
jgi:hypothetical protein